MNKSNTIKNITEEIRNTIEKNGYVELKDFRLLNSEGIDIINKHCNIDDYSYEEYQNIINEIFNMIDEYRFIGTDNGGYYHNQSESFETIEDLKEYINQNKKIIEALEEIDFVISNMGYIELKNHELSGEVEKTYNLRKDDKYNSVSKLFFVMKIKYNYIGDDEFKNGYFYSHSYNFDDEKQLLLYFNNKSQENEIDINKIESEYKKLFTKILTNLNKKDFEKYIKLTKILDKNDGSLKIDLGNGEYDIPEIDLESRYMIERYIIESLTNI